LKFWSKEGKVVPVNAMNSSWRSISTALLILILDTRWRSVVNFRLRPFYPGKESQYPLNKRFNLATDLVWMILDRTVSLALPEYKPEPSSPYFVAIPIDLPISRNFG
jgi:hypothetical protein